jgi:excisionase family DNA binding protein
MAAATSLTRPHRNLADDHLEPLVVRPRVAWRLLDCGNAYGYRLIAAGELESYRDGRARKITVESIRRYIKRRLADGGAS